MMIPNAQIAMIAILFSGQFSIVKQSRNTIPNPTSIVILFIILYIFIPPMNIKGGAY